MYLRCNVQAYRFREIVETDKQTNRQTCTQTDRHTHTQTKYRNPFAHARRGLLKLVKFYLGNIVNAVYMHVHVYTNLSSIHSSSSYGTVVWPLLSRIASLWPAKRMTIEIQHSILLFYGKYWTLLLHPASVCVCVCMCVCVWCVNVYGGGGM